MIDANIALHQQAAEASADSFHQIEWVPADEGRLCGQCSINDLCATVELKEETLSEIMRLSQTIAPDTSFELYRRAVERCEGRTIEDEELLPVLRKLHAHSIQCATWRATGRHA